MQIPDNVQNILAYGQGYNDGMKDGHICGFHDALVCAVHNLTALLKKYAELEMEYGGLQEKARRERLENIPQFEHPETESELARHGRWIELPNPCRTNYECSECGALGTVKTPYCAYCSADMREVNED